MKGPWENGGKARVQGGKSMQEINNYTQLRSPLNGNGSGMDAEVPQEKAQRTH